MAELPVADDPLDALGDDVVARVRMQGLVASSMKLHGLDWDTVAIEQSRFSASTFERCTFSEVLFTDCELSGVTFIDCRFRSCVISGGKARAMLAFTGSSMSGLAMSLPIDRLEIQNSRVDSLLIAGCTINQVVFSHCRPLGKHGFLRMVDVNLGSVGGISKLPAAGVNVEVDSNLWDSLGTLYLKQLGIATVADTERIDVFD